MKPTDSSLTMFALARFARQSIFCVITLAMISAASTFAQNAELVMDIFPGSDTSSPEELTNLEGELYFSADDGVHGRELWKHNLKTGTTEMVMDIFSGSDSSAPSSLTNFFGRLYFAADDGQKGRELWRHDPVTGKTVMLSDIRSGSEGSAPRSLTVVVDVLFFTAHDGSHGREVWARLPESEDGSMFLVEDINPNNAETPENESPPTSLTAVGQQLFFLATDGTHGYEVWVTDPTSLDPHLVQDIVPGIDSSLAADLVDFNGTLFFTVFDAAVSPGRRLWKSDGTFIGTSIVDPSVIAGVPIIGERHVLMPVDKKLYFAGSTAILEGEELFVTDGTAGGTVRVKDIRPGSQGSRPGRLTKVFGVVLFNATDGLFHGEPPPDGGLGSELWRSDGTDAGTRLVKDIFAENDSGFATSSFPDELLSADGICFFAARDAESSPVNSGHGESNLWMSDGTEAGTQRVPGSPNRANPNNLRYLNTTLFFVADDGSHGRELWKYSLPDADGDGLLDRWESDGIDYDMDGTADLNLAGFGASPIHKDIFLEIDFMATSLLTHRHRPQQASLDLIAEAFRAAPVFNPDGQPGINVHLLIDEEIPEVSPIAFGPIKLAGAAGTFADLKKEFFGRLGDRATPKVVEARRLVFRYGIFGHQDLDRSRKPRNGGVAELFGDDLMVNLGEWTEKQFRSGGGTSDLTQARQIVESGILMHELGHTLGLDHGGNDDINGKPNYLSVMNYAFATRNIDLKRPLDFSRSTLAIIDESDFFSPFRLDENVGIGGPAGRNTVYGLIDWKENNSAHALDGIDNDQNGIIDRYVRVAPASGPIDWNGDGTINPATDFLRENVHDLRRRIDRNGDFAADVEITYVEDLTTRMLKGFDDWQNLRYNFRDAFNTNGGLQFPASPVAADLSGEQVEAGAAIADSDGDGVSNSDDNCPEVVNPNQLDSNNDGIGDACQSGAPQADLAITKTASPGAVKPGDLLKYTLRITNQGLDAALNALVTDNLPALLTFVSASPAGSGTGNNRTFTFPSLAAGAFETITLTAQVNSDAPDGAAISNAASITSDTQDTNPDNNMGTAVVNVSIPSSLAISNVSVDKPVLAEDKHDLVPVTVSYTTSGGSGAVTCALSVSITDTAGGKKECTQPGKGNPEKGKDDTDIVVIDAQHLLLRSGIGKHCLSRIYDITITCEDNTASQAAVNVTVTVQDKKSALR